MFYNTPRLPRALLHILTVIKRTYVRGPRRTVKTS